MIYANPVNLILDDIFLNLNILSPENNIYLKLEGLSLTGSIKVKSAIYMVEQLEKSGLLFEGKTVIESSSGNLGLALSMVCANKGYKFICVSDPNISPFNKNMIKAYGAELVIINEKDENGGFLGSRIKYIKNLINKDRNLVWTNQYENYDNVKAHYYSTAKAITKEFPKIDYIFVGAGTTGTLGGVSTFIRENYPKTKIIAVDTLGSVTFGGEAGKRFIPGLGTSSPPPIREYSSYDEIIYIPELETIKMCNKLATKGYCFGGSTGTVLVGMRDFLKEHNISNAIVVAISPDMGEKYIDTVYDHKWVNEKFGVNLNEAF